MTDCMVSITNCVVSVPDCTVSFPDFAVSFFIILQFKNDNEDQIATNTRKKCLLLLLGCSVTYALDARNLSTWLQM